MSRARSGAILTLTLCLFGACASAPNPSAQSLVESIAGSNKDVVRLSVHAIPEGEADYKSVASTSADKLGKPSDPEDLKAVESGEMVVLDEPGAIDITVPILKKEGKATAAAGITVNAAMGRDAAVKLARSIAEQIEQGMSNAAMKKE